MHQVRQHAIAALSALFLATAAAGAQEPVTLTFAAHYTDAEMAPLTACFRRYESETPGVRIAYRQTPIADFMQNVMTSRISGASPDIYNVYSIWGKRLVDNAILAEPPREIADFIADGFEASTVQSAVVDDRLWGIPAEVAVYMLIYNKQLFAEAGIAEPPKDWAGVMDAAGKIAKRDALGRVEVAGYAFGPSVANAAHPFRTLLFSKGSQILTDDLAGTHLTEPAAVEVLEGQARLFRDGLTSASHQIRDFPAGRIGMIIGANWMKQLMREGLGDKLDAVVGVAPIPGWPDWKTYQYSFYQAVDANSPHPAEAWTFLRWLNTPAAAGQRSCVGDMLVSLGSLTANKADLAASEAEFGDAFSRPFVDALRSGRALSDPNIAQTAEMDRVLRTAIEEAWLGRLAPADALAKADREITDLLALPQ
ncbi:extracellular solute-binding protein [Aureimonas pseudogalii]|uniref:Multiple sugar transport system substrate-binding protein n=1 Tax=Aureimonas pseudogalii TaxID=1744844 RepID=A0A7W6H6L4_9HYPH|nr:extracellular solute-binding protein [Aureimonas pseudogalii]MBB3999545.1 multiple sugar transport system substrate-binding protein [Aureimonas pseudogalii]